MNASTTGVTDPSRCQLLPATGSAELGTDHSARKSEQRPRRRSTVIAALGTTLLLAGCNYPSYGASKGATAQGYDTYKLWSGMMTTGIIVGGIVALLILWSVFRYRKRSDEIPRQFHEHIALEIVYTVVPVIIVGVLFYFTVLTENNVDRTVPLNATVTATGRPVVDITVTAFQWGWRFDYPGLNVGVAGETTHGPGNHGPQMVVPVGETVQITLVSDDVIHGFYVRDFNFSRYAQPGITNRFDLTVLHSGTFDGQCTQFCGLYHSQMLFSVRAVSPSAFATWASSEVQSGHVIVSSGSSASNNPPTETHSTPPSGSQAAASTAAIPTAKAPA